MSVNVFPPASGGGGGGAAPLPGATTEVVSGKFKLFATANIPLEPGSYVATVLASSSGGTELDSKKLTSKAVGVLQAGVTTLETVTESEAGVAFFAKAQKENLPLVSSQNSSIPYNGNKDDYDNMGSYSSTYLHSYKTPAFTYLFMKGEQRVNGSSTYSKTWSFRSSDGLTWQETNSQTSPSGQSNWRKASYITYSDGMYRFAYGPSSQSGYYYPIYFESVDGATWTQTTLSNSSGNTYYQTNDAASVVYKYGGQWFWLGDSKAMKMSSITGQATNIYSNLPNFYIGTTGATGFGNATGKEFCATNFAILYTTDGWATHTLDKTVDVFGTTAFGTNAGGYGNGYYAINNYYNNYDYRYTTDFVTWSTGSIPSRSNGTVFKLFYDPRLNRWIANSTSNTDEIYYSTTGSPTSWSTWTGQGSSAHGYYLYKTESSSGRIYGAPSLKNVWSFIPFSSTMSATAQSWSQDMQSFAVASNQSGSVTLIGGYGSSSGSSVAMIVRATDELNFTEIPTPFLAGQNYCTFLTWDQTNLQFVAGSNGGQIATSPDGLTWTIRATVDDAGDTGVRGIYQGIETKDGIVQFPGNLYPMARATTATISDLALVEDSYSGSQSNWVYAIEEAGETYVVSSSGQLAKQLSTSPTFDTSNMINTNVSHSTSDNARRTPMKKVNGVWFAFSTSANKVTYSTNFTTWQTLNADGIVVQDVDYDVTNSRWVAVGANSIAYSTDFVTWFGVKSPGVETHRSALRVSEAAIGFTAATQTNKPAEEGSLSQTEEYGVLYFNSDLESL
jgi:hypothetical protein